MADSLVGFSGYVGSTLSKQRSFSHTYRSTNISEIKQCSFDILVCAAAPAQKWIANRDPRKDLEIIESLKSNLKSARCKTFILISTVDVFPEPVGVDEDSEVRDDGLKGYGLNRRNLEKFVQDSFSNHLIVRLPGLVGPGLRKNVIYDLHNNNNLASIDSNSIYQFYPMVNLWYDIQLALAAGLKLVHLTAEPLSVELIAREAFGKNFTRSLGSNPASYDFQTKHAAMYNADGPYQYRARDSILATRAYAQSEPFTDQIVQRRP